MAKFKLNVGDIFTIPLSNNQVGFGQIVNFPITKDCFIMVVFDYRQDLKHVVDLANISSSPILFLGYSLDAKLYHNSWSVIGNLIENISQIVLPYHKLGISPNDMSITDYKGKILREATANEFARLSYQTIISPIRYENALKAFYKFKEWNMADYDNLLYKHTLNSNEIFNSPC